MLNVSRVAGGQRNVTLHITGCVEKDMPLTPIDTGIKERMKLSSMVWVVQEKLGITLFWGSSKEDLILPMESRNSVRLDTGLQAPEWWDGKMYISTFNFAQPPTAPVKSFFFVLDFDR